MSVVSFKALNKQLSSLENQYKEFVVRCPFKKCNCRIIAYKYHSNSLKNHLVKVDKAPECIYLDPQFLEIVNPAIDEVKSGEQPKSVANGLKSFFKVNDAWDFDNIGVSRPAELQKPSIEPYGEVNIERYLVCADCERGPIGFAGLLLNVEEAEGETEEDKRIHSANKLIYFLNSESVRYELR